MFLRFVTFLFAITCSLNCLAQAPIAAVRQTKAVPIVHHTVAVVTPPINNIAGSPKEVYKKKRKSVPVTVAQKPKPIIKETVK
ncbi:MAG: hypothetical protein ABI763_08415 [Bacteroidota bacterium]